MLRCKRVRLVIIGSSTRITWYTREVKTQKCSEDYVKGDRRPQQDTGQTTRETEVKKIQRNDCA